MTVDLILAITAIITALVGMISLATAMNRIQKSNVEKMQMLVDASNSNKERIENLRINHDKDMVSMRETFELKIEQMRQQRQERVDSIFKEVDNIKIKHEKDIELIFKKIDETTNRMQDIEDRHHGEVLKEIRNLVGVISALQTVFDERKSQKNG